MMFVLFNVIFDLVEGAYVLIIYIKLCHFVVLVKNVGE